jgi:PAS domain S-box-containing protein
MNADFTDALSEHPQPGAGRNPAVRDLVLIVGATLVLLVAASLTDLAERLRGLQQRHESFELDEILLAALVLAVGSALFSWRRWRELRRETVNRRVAEEALRRNRDLLKAILDNSPACFAVKSRDGKFLTVNRSFEKVFEATESRVRGTTGQGQVPTALVGLTEADQRVLSSGQPELLQEVWRDGDEARTVQIARFPLVGPEGPWAVCLLATDETERLRVEERLRQAQKMEAVGQLAGGIAHDFNNLLCVISGSSELLALDLGPRHAGQPRLAQIRRASDRAADLVRKLLAFSRKQVLRPQLVDLGVLVDELVPMIQSAVGESIKVVLDRGREPAWVNVDGGQMEQVLLNLALNSRDAMPTGGTLTIEIAKHTGRVLLSVRDTGCGIAADVMPRVFEPFFTTKEQGKGTGLGLASVYGIVAQSGGQIAVDSAPAQGASFRIDLPAAASAAPRGAGRADTASDAAADALGTALLVEDDNELRGLVRQLLEATGYTVLEAESGQEALDKVRHYGGTLDVLLTDVVMPGMNGFALAAALRNRHPHLAVVLMSGYSEDSVRRQGTIGEGMAFLAKPFRVAELMSALRKAQAGAEEARGAAPAGAREPVPTA